MDPKISHTSTSTTSSSKSKSNSNSNSNQGEEEESFEKVSSNASSRSGSEGSKKARAEDEAFFKLPHLPDPSSSGKKKIGSKLEAKKIAPVSKGRAESDSNEGEDEDDWFKAQLGEFGDKKPSGSAVKHTYSVEDESAQRSPTKKSGESGAGRSLWEWTGIQDVVSAMGRRSFK
jgi:hypothetical protein